MQSLSMEGATKAGVPAQVAAEVKTVGASSLESSGLLDQLKEEVSGTNKARAEHRIAALSAIETLAGQLGEAGEPYGVALLPALLKCASDKDKKVGDAANAAAKAVAGSLCVYATKQCVPMLLAGCDSSNRWQTIALSLELMTSFAEEAPKQVAQCMSEIVPVLIGLLQDSKKQVKDNANLALRTASNTAANADIEKLLPAIVSAMEKVSERPETIYELASTTFVQTVETAALAMVAPLLLYGIRERNTKLRRQCAVIINNMSKLVEDPSEAAPFIPTLLPALEKAAEEVSDPECREVCQKACEQLRRIDAHYQKTGDLRAKPEKVTSLINSHLPGLGGVGAAFLCGVICSLVDAKCLDKDAWNTSIKPYVEECATAAEADAAIAAIMEECAKDISVEDEAEEEDAEQLCDCQFTLAYGNKILLHNTRMKLNRGYKYGLLGGNDSGKTTLMRSIANGQVEGFPDASEVRTVFVEADIQGELSHLNCVDYIYEDERIKACGIPRDAVQNALDSVGFSPGPGIACYNNGVSTLSGGWRMKLALARAMLQKADILLMDEPTNHLDVINVKWVKDYLNGLKDVTCIMVSHDSGLLNEVCNNIMAIKNLKLHQAKGNLESYVNDNPDAKSFFELKTSKFSFKFPQPGPIKGVNNKGKFLMKMDDCTFTYPGNETPTISDITVRVSLGSRVACLGVNGAGKSTMIKILTGELVPQTGNVWKHPSARVAYVAQHAFHHIEKHLNKTPNEYIRWRYEAGDDKETLVKQSMTMTEEEEKKCKEPVEIPIEGADGKTTKMKRIVDNLTGARKEIKGQKEPSYEVKFNQLPHDANLYLKQSFLAKAGFEKHMKAVDEKIAIREGFFAKPLTSANVEQHICDVGLEKEYATHTRMSALSGGQKVKVVLAAAMWNQPHILILDEPTNYLDRDSLGALSGAIEEFGGGVVMITHNNEFCSKLCPETWLLQGGRLDCQGDAQWMENVMKEKVEDQNKLTEMVDGLGNTIKLKNKDKKMSRKEIKAMSKQRKAALDRGEDLSDDEDWDGSDYIGAKKK